MRPLEFSLLTSAGMAEPLVAADARRFTVGHRISCRYSDTIYQTRTRTHPGDTITLRVQIEPAH